MKPIFLLVFVAGLWSCSPATEKSESAASEPAKTRVIFDTDANNELDDQHAMAYLFFNGSTFDVEGVTVNATKSGGDIDAQTAEAERIIKLCGLEGKIPFYKGANGSFENIRETTDADDFDGSAAVNFLIGQANKSTVDKLVVIAVGKLTNVALALKKDPSFAKKVRVVWLGSNYPEPGEYNQDNDTISMNYVLNSTVPFEMVTVRYGKPSGTDAIQVTKEEAEEKMPGLGPTISSPVTGRHGGEFSNFGDYSVSLFEHISYHGNPPARALFDMAAVAIVKNGSWAESKEIPCPILVDNQWVERPGNARKITVWENFDKEAILEDFFRTLNNYEAVEAKM